MPAPNTVETPIFRIVPVFNPQINGIGRSKIVKSLMILMAQSARNMEFSLRQVPFLVRGSQKWATGQHMNIFAAVAGT